MTTFTDIKLRFADQAAYEAAFAALGWPTRDGETDALLPYPQGETFFGYAGFSVIETPAEIDEETSEVVTPAVLAAGFHVDVRLIGIDPPEGLVPFVVTPSHPVHEFA